MSRRPYKHIRERAEEVLDYIKSYFDRNYKSPTYDEILEGVGLSTKSHLAHIIKYLVRVGSLECEEGIARGLSLPGWTPPTLFPVHLKGYVAASNKNPQIVLDELDADSIIEIPPSFIPNNTKLSDLYALTVRGDSMEEALIADGDIVILKQGGAWNDGDIVVVWLNEEGAQTLKQLYRSHSNTVKLRPRSHKHQTRVENEADVRVMGRMVAVMRKYAS